MGFDWEGILGEDGYAYVCDHGLDCYGYSRRSEGYSSSYDDDDYDYDDYDEEEEEFIEDEFCEDEFYEFEDDFESEDDSED